MVSFEENPKQLLDDWPLWRERIIQLAKVESATRPFLKKILASLESNVVNKEGMVQLIFSILENMLCLVTYN